jgi:hypothetical protein
MGISILAWLSSRDPQYGSRDDNQANMEMPMYWIIYYILLTSRKETPILAWDEDEAHHVLARANMGLDMEMILYQVVVIQKRLFSRGVKIWTVYFWSYWSYKNAFIWTKYVINEYIILRIDVHAAY